jgi:alpha-ribazole phosphatase
MVAKAPLTTVDLLRHGEPQGGRRYRGQIDDPLSEKGWMQMRTAVADHAPWSRILSSPLSRCSAFAEELALRHTLPLEIFDAFSEIGFGAWEGKSAEQLMAEDAQILYRFWSDPLNNTPPGAETLAAFEQRVIGQWHTTLAQYVGEHLLIVGHAGVMRMIISHVLGMPVEKMFRLQIPNAAISRIQVDHLEEGVLPRLLFHAGQL